MICGDCGEDGLWEDVRPVELPLDVDDGPRSALRPDHQIDPRLEAVHRIQNDLDNKERKKYISTDIRRLLLR